MESDVIALLESEEVRSEVRRLWSRSRFAVKRIEEIRANGQNPNNWLLEYSGDVTSLCVIFQKLLQATGAGGMGKIPEARAVITFNEDYGDNREQQDPPDRTDRQAEGDDQAGQPSRESDVPQDAQDG